MIKARCLPLVLPALLMLHACGKDATPSRSEATSMAQTSADAPPPAFAACRTCHSLEPGRNAAGPSLAGIAGRKAGTMPSYPYSPALKASGIVWNRDTLDQWLTNPMQMVPGTRMVMPVADPEMRKAIVDYLMTLK